jgi:hypothetical protein
MSEMVEERHKPILGVRFPDGIVLSSDAHRRLQSLSRCKITWRQRQESGDAREKIVFSGQLSGRTSRAMITSLDALTTDTCPAVRDDGSLGFWWVVEHAKFFNTGDEQTDKMEHTDQSYCRRTSLGLRASWTIGHHRQGAHSNSTRHMEQSRWQKELMKLGAF